MVGKLLLQEDEIKLKSRHGYFLIENIEEIKNKLKKKSFENDPLWVEFEINPNVNRALITKLYDSDFGTPKENISIAIERYERNKYPIGGFIPGFNHKKCSTCKNNYIGSESSSQCEICANNL